jgi:hypothetical protein
VADAALFLGWGEVITGREKKSLEVFAEVLGYFGRLQQEGGIESFEPVLLAPHGGDLDGFVLVRGDRQQLAQIRFSDEFERLLARGALVVSRLGVVPAYVGESLNAEMGRFQKEIADVT